jgi:hypothetical protein
LPELEEELDDELDIFLVVCLCGTIVKYENMFNIYRIFDVVVGKTIFPKIKKVIIPYF